MVAGCGGAGSEPGDVARGGEAATTLPATLPLGEHFLDDPEVTTVATDLAPSQRTGSTVPDPAVAEPCGAADVEMWTARVAPDGASAVIRMRNVSDTWCDLDIGRSPQIDPAIEPDVWLRPGETADLVVGSSEAGCEAPDVVDRVQVGIGDESVLVPTSMVTCGWWLQAFYPNDVVRVACELADLDVAVTGSAVVLRNASATPCGTSGPVGVDGARLVAPFATDPVVRELFPGDVVSLGRPDGEGCEGVTERIVIEDEAYGRLEVSAVPCEIVFELGASRPWFGTDVGPPAALPDRSTGPSSVVEALDPFGDAE